MRHAPVLQPKSAPEKAAGGLDHHPNLEAVFCRTGCSFSHSIVQGDPANCES